MKPRPPIPILAAAAVGVAFIGMVLAGLASRVPWTRLGSILTSEAATDALRLSLVTASAAAGLATIVGVPIGWLVARHDGPAAGIVRGVVLVPMVLPPVVAGVALLATFGRRGLLGEAVGGLPFTTLAVVLAQAFVALPFVVLTIEAGVQATDAGLDEAAADAGASPWFSFVHVTLPMLRPSIIAAVLLAWARALGEFGATVTFAGSVAGRTRTLPLAVVTALQGDPDVAVALSAVLVALSLVVLVLLRGRWLTPAHTRRR